MSDWLLDVDARVIDAIKIARERGFVSTGDAVIVVTGWVRNYLIIIFFSHSFSFSVPVLVQQIHYVLSMLIKSSIIIRFFAFE
jgi:hypothetical protein